MNRYQEHKQGLKMLNTISDDNNDYYFIHYAVDYRSTNRIATIAIRRLSFEGEIINFSLDLEAQALNLPINSQTIDRLEFSMLSKYFKFMKEHTYSKFIHWNMSSDEYGFKAIENRAKELNLDREIVTVPENQRLNLSHCFKKIYGVNYISDPKFYNLMRLNGIHSKDLLEGKQEAQRIKIHDFKSVALSCDKKVDIFYQLYFLAISDHLKVQTSWVEIYGLSIQSIYEVLKKKWWFDLLCFLVGVFVTLLLERCF